MKTLKMEEDKKNSRLLFEFGIIFMILNLLCVTGIWQSLLCDWQMFGDASLYLQAYVDASGKYIMESLNQQSLYLSLLTFVFSFLGNKEELVLIVNLILQLMGILFLFIGVRKSAGILFALISVLVSVIGCILWFPISADSSMHLLWLLSAFIYCLCMKIISLNKVHSWLYAVMGILCGFFVYLDFAGILPLLAVLLSVLRIKSYQGKREGRNKIIFVLSIGISFLVIFYLWNNYRLDIQVLKQWFYERQAYMFHKDAKMPYVLMTFVFLLQVIMGGIYQHKNKVVPVPDVFLTEELQYEGESSTVVDEKQGTITEKALKSEVATVEKSEKKEVTEEEKPKVKLLENPLPVPKKHMKKEMNYGFEPSEDQMHYDLNNYRVDDDYDLKTGL